MELTELIVLKLSTQVFHKIFLKFEYGQDFKNWTLIDSMVSQPRSIHTVSNKKQQITKT